MCLSQTINSIGLIFNMAGVIILVKDQWRALPKTGVIGIIHSKKAVAGIVNKFKMGVMLLIAGFFIQLISNFL